MAPWEKRQQDYRKRKPWARFVEWARRRCNDKDSKWFRYYGAKGITCDIVVADLEEVWKRDKAEKMTRPSLDRKDPKKNYTKDNVRFIEFNLNARLAWDPKSRNEYEPEPTDEDREKTEREIRRIEAEVGQ